MGQGERTNRKTVIDHAKAAVDAANAASAKTVECVEAVNRQAQRIEAVDRRVSDVDQRVNRRFAAQGALVEELGSRLDERTAHLARMIEAHQQMGLLARLRWLFTGSGPTVEMPAADTRPPQARSVVIS